jgi:hypothetical protein
MRPIHPQVLTIPLNTPRPQKRGQIKASHRGQVELTRPLGANASEPFAILHERTVGC